MCMPRTSPVIPSSCLATGVTHDGPQILIHGDDAVLHLVHDHAHGLIGAALVEDALVDAIQNGVIAPFRASGLKPLFSSQAGVDVSRPRRNPARPHDPFHGRRRRAFRTISATKKAMQMTRKMLT